MIGRVKQVTNQYPNLSKGLLIGTLLASSDTAAQMLFEQKYNWKRNFQFFVLGFGWMAPAIQLWYGNLLPRITAKYLVNLSKTPAIIARTLIDNLIFPPLSYAGFYLLRDLLFRKKHQVLTFKQQFKNKFVPTVLADWAVWIPANFINFWFVPVQWQGVFVGVFSFFFDIALSYIANQDPSHVKKSDRKSFLRLKINRFLQNNCAKEPEVDWW